MSLLSLTDAAHIAGVTRGTMRRYIDRGVLPATRTGANRYRISEKNLEAFMAGDSTGYYTPAKRSRTAAS